MREAKVVIDNPGDYTTYQFRQTIENLQAAYQAAQDFATGIMAIEDSKTKIQNDVYDLSGRKLVNGQLPRGIYVIGGRKVMIK